MKNKKHIINLEYFREMLQICPKLPDQQFEELPFEEAILTFLKDLGSINSKKEQDKLALCQGLPHVHHDQGKRLKATTKVTKPAKKKQPAKTSKAKGLTVLSGVTLTKLEQMKLALKRSLIQTHSSHASGSGTNEATGGKPRVPNVPTYRSDDEQISWKSSEEEDDDDDNDDDDDDADNQNDDGQEYDEQDDEDQDDIDKQDEEDSFDPRVQTPSHVESTDDEDSDEEIQGVNVEGDEQDEEETNEEVKANELYMDVNVNLVGRDTEMTDASRTIIQTTQVIEDTHVIITSVNPEDQQQSSYVSSGLVSNMLNPTLDTGIDSIFNLNTESTSLVDVPVTTITEPPLLSATTLPPPPTPLITHLQQTLVPTPVIVQSSSLQDLPNFGSLFGFDHRLKTLENDFSEFKQTNQFATAVSLIPGIVDAYLANKMNEAIKIAVQLQSDRLQDEAQAKNEDFINKLDENIKKIIKDQVKEQVKAQVSKILPEIEKTVNEQLEAEVLTRSSNESKTSHAVAANLSKLELKKILIDIMESNKSIYKSDEQKNLYKALVDAYESDNLTLNTYGDTKLAKPPTPDHDWNKTLPDAHGHVQPWLSSLAQTEDLHESFNELMDTPLDFSAFVMNRLKVDTLTPELLAGLTFELMKGSCKSLHLDWITIHRDDDKLYKFKEGDFKRLCIQDIKDMVLLLIQGKLTNLTVEERLDFNVSFQISDLKRREAYTAYSNPRGFIYQNKDKKNRLMHIDELLKFSDGTLNDVQTALDDRLKGIRMKYLPQTIWRQSDRDKAGAMIQEIDKQLKTKRIMRSLEKFIGGRPHEGDFRLLQWTI
ncbi:hypothetical protein Tco_1282265 [Tanacetum coccineum]